MNGTDEKLRDDRRASHVNMNLAARATVVNRTHRVVRARAKTMAARRSRVRSLWIPTALCSAFLVMISTAVWTVLDQYDVAPIGMPDASNQFLVFLLWFFPVSMVLAAVLLFRRTRRRVDSEATQ